MTRVASRPAPIPRPKPSVPDRLHVLARQIERLAVGGRLDPERIFMEKSAIAVALRDIASELRT